MSDLRRTVPGLERPSVAGITYLLRHPELWPEGFKWDYARTAGCGLGLMGMVWNADALRMELIAVSMKGCGAFFGLPGYPHQVKPEDVADKLDEIVVRDLQKEV